MDRRAISCFDAALVDAGLTAEPLRGVLHDYFAWATTTSMATYHASADDVPPGLTIPHWSWPGLIRPGTPTPAAATLSRTSACSETTTPPSLPMTRCAT
jgi:hemoglobin